MNLTGIADRFIRKKKHKKAKCRKLKVLIISANDLKNVKHLTRMRTYAVAYVEPDRTAATHVDEEGGVNPMWNEQLTVKFRKTGNATAALNVDIYAHGHIREKPVGSARVLLSDLPRSGRAASNPMTLQVWRASGQPQGFLTISLSPAGRFVGQNGEEEEAEEEEEEDDDEEEEEEEEEESESESE